MRFISLQVATVTAYFTYWAVVAILFVAYYVQGKRHPTPCPEKDPKQLDSNSGNGSLTMNLLDTVSVPDASSVMVRVGA